MVWCVWAMGFFSTRVSVVIQGLLFTVVTVGGLAAAPGDRIDPQNLDAALASRLIVEKTNAERAKAKLGALKHNAQLAVVAERHSRDMAERNYFSHNTKRFGRDIPFSKRMSMGQLRFGRTAENLALQPIMRDIGTYDQLARATVEGWMNSPGHRKNILMPELNLIGVGIAVGNRGNQPYAYITQDFAQQ
jgi:uncharacterized protein YkwD